MVIVPLALLKALSFHGCERGLLRISIHCWRDRSLKNGFVLGCVKEILGLGMGSFGMGFECGWGTDQDPAEWSLGSYLGLIIAPCQMFLCLREHAVASNQKDGGPVLLLGKFSC